MELENVSEGEEQEVEGSKMPEENWWMKPLTPTPELKRYSRIPKPTQRFSHSLY